MAIRIELKKPTDEEHANAIFTSLFLTVRSRYEALVDSVSIANAMVRLSQGDDISQSAELAPPLESKLKIAAEAFDSVISLLPEGNTYAEGLKRSKEPFLDEIRKGEGGPPPSPPRLYLVK